MILTKEDVLKLIPQDHPMVLVDELLSISDDGLQTSFFVEKDHLLVKDDFLMPAALIENMAQTAAVLSGYEAKQAKRKAKKGFIGAIKNFEIHHPVSVGSLLTTDLRVTYKVFNASIVEGIIRSGEKIIAEGELKIFLLDE
ncbi:MAG: hypothetical protein JXR60_03535 [Bacteroidales bacterium]|nr:hypothetical protein [Bacteroidales bacterium]